MEFGCFISAIIRNRPRIDKSTYKNMMLDSSPFKSFLTCSLSSSKIISFFILMKKNNLIRKINLKKKIKKRRILGPENNFSIIVYPQNFIYHYSHYPGGVF
ncbi:hypothetical protein BpHYR1_027488 [Brachionus plicatilis]|uniref:Uncharacterized protein n=1 Tax=Brachionus plicatilis TaxID=10195 RepID=A0A3M7RZ10_BRAPC|nr:hypothetical protein BpHYR1_027488 [Brachionus plicatilis]